jgi:polyisoprenoid-binding protein YceI
VSIATPQSTRRFLADPVHSSFGFAVRYMGVSTFRGSFAEVDAALSLDADGTATLGGMAQAESISITTPAEFRAHVLGDEFLAADRHPQITFRAAGLELGEPGGPVSVTGELTIRGITRRVQASGDWAAPVEDPFGSVRAALELETTIDRRDYGITWNMPLPKGGDALATQVRLVVHLELVEEV